MRIRSDDDILTALRQASAIAAISGERSTRRILGLAHDLYNAVILLEPNDRARRIRLIDEMFTPRSRRESAGRTNYEPINYRTCRPGPFRAG